MEINFTPEKQTMLTLAAVTEIYNDLTVTVERGARTISVEDGDDKVQKGYLVKNEAVSGFGAKIETAIKTFLKAMKYGTIEDFTFDTDNEFFAAAPKVNVDKNDPWARADAEELANLRVAAENEAQAAVTDEGNAQAHWLKQSEIINEAYDLLKSKKAVEAWARGSDANASAAPTLAKLGNAPHALTEARLMANLTDLEFSHLHVNINRGKAIDLEIRKGSEDIMYGAAAAALAEHDVMQDGEHERLTDDCLLAGMFGAIDAIGVSDDYADVGTGLTLAQSALDTMVASAAENGINKHTDSDDERAVLRKIVATSQAIKWIGDCAKAMEALKEARALDPKKDAAVLAKAVKAAKSDLYQGSFYRKLTNAIAKRANEAAAKKAKEGAVKAAADGDPFNGAKKAWEELDARDMAARVFASFKGHPAFEAVADNLSHMIASEKSARREAAAAAAKQAAE